MEIVHLENISYKYPTSKEAVLKNISLSLEAGKVYALIGENGGGKSTLCSLIRGFIPHVFKGDLEGKAVVFEKDIVKTSLGEFADMIGYVAQNPFTQITGTTESVYEEVGYGLESLGKKREEILETIDQVLEIFHIEDLAEKKPNELSGGQKQKVALASVYAMNPDLFIIDEPTSQLDPVGTNEIFSIVSQLKEFGKTVLLVENKIELVAQYADEIFLVKDGKIIDHGTPTDLLTKKSTAENGSFLPQFTMLAWKLHEEGFPIDVYPVLQEEAVEMVSKLRMQGNGGDRFGIHRSE
ncbi:MAG: energy-coupling factor ABC transporter ATP-binding protein [Enterococcaceae bacterium]|jgi:energy-coupling factor transport system ATP-binding protein|nr:energy-coupling factor ABC transporter ATP-binding protein [Enterococcaceae bacterium]MCI1919073.1 energy-coupling factor ABC transporter ATP-binding protein [Enterococcaceae bacterium]